MKFRETIINCILSFLCLCLLMVFMLLCNKYSKTHHQASTAYQDMKAAEYRAQTEQLKMQTAKVKLETEEIRLRAFIRAYSNAEYPGQENNE